MTISIVIDTREQAPYTFAGYDAGMMRGTLDSGDYTISGFEDMVAVERKELGDLLGCLTRERERFGRELGRLRGYQSAALVVEAPFEAIAAGQYRSKMPPESVVQSILSLSELYRLPVFFARDRRQGEFFTFHFLRHFARHALARYRALGTDTKN